MKKFILLFALQIIALTSFAQGYLAISTADVNLREGPSTEYNVIRCLKEGTALYVDSVYTVDGWYLVVDIKHDIEGYVSSKYVRLGKLVDKAKNVSIEKGDITSDYNPVLNIKNDTNISLSLKLNDKLYKFFPQETKTLTLNPGYFTFRASSPGVIPYSGEYTLESNYKYNWRFFIVTSRR